MNHVIDSSGWLEYFTNGKLADKYAQLIEKAQQVNFFTPSVVLYEVYKKLLREKGKEAAVRAAMQITAKTIVIQLTTSIAIEAAELSVSNKLAMADSIIKATANDVKAELSTSDPDFRGLAGVNLIE